jgi:SAM-dependent MidA family methyltransferase
VTVTERVRRTVRREGPVPFDRFVDLALHDPEGGFFERGGAGRAGGDFVTSPEIGPLFGECVARALDGWWAQLGRPDPFVVVEAGAGSGRLARDVLRAAPACSPALRYVLVERSAALRAAQREHLPIEPPDEALGPFTRARPTDDDVRHVPGTGPVVTALDDLPAGRLAGVVLANELLDNLPFGIARRTHGGWEEVLVGIDGDHLVEVTVPLSDRDADALGSVFGVAVADGARVPLPRGIDTWVHACAACLTRGLLVVVDYVVDAAELLARAPDRWLRTYRSHRRGTSPLDDPGSQDITADVVREQLLHAAEDAGFSLVDDDTQADWLRALGIEELAAGARRAWDARSHVGDLEAVAARSRVGEAAALVDPAGLGAHRVVVLGRGARPRSAAADDG